MATQYRDVITKQLITLLNAEGPATLQNRYYYGDPILVPKSALPAVFISRDKTTITNASNAEDESSMEFVINVVLDLTRDFNQALDSIGSTSSLYDVIEGRNDDGTLRAGTIAYVLRKHAQLADKLWISLRDGLELDYGVGVEKRGPGIYTVEGVLRFTVTQHRLRPGLGA